MKKLLLSAIVAIATAGSIQAINEDVFVFKNPVMPEMKGAPALRLAAGSAARVAKAANATDWTLSYMKNVNGLMSMGLNQEQKGLSLAIKMPEELVKQCAGSSITEFTFYMGSLDKPEGKIFISSSLGGTPLYSEDVAFTVNNWNTVKLATPYVIPETDTPAVLYFGYSFDCPVANSNTGANCPIVIDGSVIDDGNGDIIYVQDKWQSIGNPLTLQVTVEGDNLPRDMMEVEDYALPYIIKPGEKPVAQFMLYNSGSNTIENVTVSTSLDGVKSEEYQAEVSLAPYSDGLLEIPAAVADKWGVYRVGAEITKVNGKAIEPVAVADYVKCIDNGYERRMLVEEWTGTWCGWCPQGIVGMEYMNATYPDNFIGIAVHSSNGPTAPDPFNLSSYINSLNKNYGVVSGFPGSFVDRTVPVSPTSQYFKLAYQLLAGNTGFADISVKAAYTDDTKKKIDITTTTVFNYDKEEVNGILAESNYGIAYVVVENGLAGRQANYFAGGESGKCGGWENMSSTVDWTFNEVARKIDSFSGKPGSVPAEIKKGEEYEYTHTMTLPTSIKDKANIDIIAILLNTTTGRVENAAKVHGPDYSGISGVIADGSNVKVCAEAGSVTVAGDCVAADVYGINGVKVASLAGEGSVSLSAGMYIVRVLSADGAVKTAKVAVR